MADYLWQRSTPPPIRRYREFPFEIRIDQGNQDVFRRIQVEWGANLAKDREQISTANKFAVKIRLFAVFAPVRRIFDRAVVARAKRRAIRRHRQTFSG